MELRAGPGEHLGGFCSTDDSGEGSGLGLQGVEVLSWVLRGGEEELNGHSGLLVESLTRGRSLCQKEVAAEQRGLMKGARNLTAGIDYLPVLVSLAHSCCL